MNWAQPETVRRKTREFHESVYSDGTYDLRSANDIWTMFIRYNLESLGVQSSIIKKYWDQVREEAFFTDPQTLIDAIERIEYCGAMDNNVSEKCDYHYSKGKNEETNCLNPNLMESCPVPTLTKILHWHRGHYRVAKIIVTCCKRWFIEKKPTDQEPNLYLLIKSIFDEFRSSGGDWRNAATEEIIGRFDNIKWRSLPPVYKFQGIPDVSYNEFGVSEVSS